MDVTAKNYDQYCRFVLLGMFESATIIDNMFHSTHIYDSVNDSKNEWYYDYEKHLSSMETIRMGIYFMDIQGII